LRFKILTKDARKDDSDSFKYTQQYPACNRGTQRRLRATYKDERSNDSQRKAWEERVIPLAAKQPPVINPEMMAFHASSFCLHPFTTQSNVENIPPHTPKLPPVTGARDLIEDIAPTRRSPYKGEAVRERKNREGRERLPGESCGLL
jgi:hypothetical protein